MRGVTADDEALARAYEAHKPLRPGWPALPDMLADPLLRHVLNALALHCPTPTRDALKRATAASIVPPGPRSMPREIRPPILDQKRKASGERDD